jgi:outer membrane protein OmpA-like peptidoglycan-associated protein
MGRGGPHCRSAAVLVAVLCAAAAAAAVPDEERDVPPGAKLKVLDIVFKVESFGGQVVDLQVKETDTEFRIELAADVLFEFDKATLLPKAEDTLKKAAAFVHERAAGVVEIEGHTDAKGDDAYNQRLSERRADSVRQWFVRNGLRDVRFASRGLGETKPVAPNAKPDGSDDPEGRQKNRRVEIVIRKKP